MIMDIYWPDYVIPRNSWVDHTESDLLNESQICDQIITYCDSLLSESKFEELNELLPQLPVEQFTPQECVSWLTFTHPLPGDKYKLTNRAELWNRVRARLVGLKGEEIADKLTRNRK